MDEKLKEIYQKNNKKVRGIYPSKLDNDRMVVQYYVEKLDFSYFEGCLDDIIDSLNDLKNKYGDRLFIDYDYYDYCSISFGLYNERYETDDEYICRKEYEKETIELSNKKESERKALEYDAERKEYERLKKKFEGA